MTELTLSLACAPYDRVQPLFDDRVKIAGCIIDPHPMPADEAFSRAYTTQDFDITELSASSHLLMSARGASPYVGIPAFVSRSFRHSSFYIRTDRGIAGPGNLKGKRIGVPQYQQTAALWARGLLADEYGVQASDIHWRNGGLDAPGGAERVPLALRGIDLQPIATGATLSAMLADGELDAVIAAHPPACFLKGAPNVTRLFPNFRETEENYFRKTGLFPVMHLIGIRRTLIEAHPWLADAVFNAFSAARDIAMSQLRYQGAFYAMLPWLPDDLSRTQAVMGSDFWSYGVTENRHELDAMRRWIVEQGLTESEPALDQIFAPDFHEGNAAHERSAMQ
jgi:4,5-dihydroxyphthalate decarboxylase